MCEIVTRMKKKIKSLSDRSYVFRWLTTNRNQRTLISSLFCKLKIHKLSKRCQPRSWKHWTKVSSSLQSIFGRLHFDTMIFAIVRRFDLVKSGICKGFAVYGNGFVRQIFFWFENFVDWFEVGSDLRWKLIDWSSRRTQENTWISIM